MPASPGALTLTSDPFPSERSGALEEAEGRPAFTLVESFARGETVVLVDYWA